MVSYDSFLLISKIFSQFWCTIWFTLDDIDNLPSTFYTAESDNLGITFRNVFPKTRRLFHSIFDCCQGLLPGTIEVIATYHMIEQSFNSKVPGQGFVVKMAVSMSLFHTGVSRLNSWLQLLVPGASNDDAVSLGNHSRDGAAGTRTGHQSGGSGS